MLGKQFPGGFIRTEKEACMFVSACPTRFISSHTAAGCLLLLWDGSNQMRKFTPRTLPTTTAKNEDCMTFVQYQDQGASESPLITLKTASQSCS